jgi:hypothetical protein
MNRHNESENITKQLHQLHQPAIPSHPNPSDQQEPLLNLVKWLIEHLKIPFLLAKQYAMALIEHGIDSVENLQQKVLLLREDLEIKRMLKSCIADEDDLERLIEVILGEEESDAGMGQTIGKTIILLIIQFVSHTLLSLSLSLSLSRL